MARSSKKPPAPVLARRSIELGDILDRLRAHGQEFDEEYLHRVCEFSAAAHQDQKRRSGEPFFNHPLYVAYLLADFNSDQATVAVGLLHDVLEDTLTDRQTLAAKFGEEVAAIVDGVTKISRHAYVRKDQAQAESFRKLILYSNRDIRVAVVKVADRLHNMMTLGHMPARTQERIARETLAIYAPIAHRLGMGAVQGDLEDLSFYYLHPEEYAALMAKVDERSRAERGATRTILAELRKELKEHGIEAEISYRVKRPYSIFRKLRRQSIDIDQLYDYRAFRIITGSRDDCYTVGGIVQNHPDWKPLLGRWKDYIASPKPNNYRSIHTTLHDGAGHSFEVQIRTAEMDSEAEFGIAAHWAYKVDGKSRRRREWLQQLLENQDDVEDPRTFLENLETDLYPEEVYAFTPKGDVHSLPRGATPLDFAYRVHTEVGHRCSGARVNGRIVPLKTELASGDRVEILTSPKKGPSRDWLNIVVTPRARSKIRAYLNTQEKERAADIGRQMLERELRKYRQSLRRVSKALDGLVEADGLGSPADLFARIGFDRTTVKDVVERLLTPEEREVAGSPGVLREVVGRFIPAPRRNPIVVKGEDDMMAFLAKCCRPLPGEGIVGYVTRGRGISVHSTECPNVKKLLYHPDREIDVEWARDRDGVYPVDLAIETEDRTGMLANLTDAIAKLKGNIRRIDAGTETGRGVINIIVGVVDSRQLDRIRKTIRAIPGVLAVDRRMKSGGRSAKTG